MRIEKEVTEYEVKYRGRELPGFVNYKTFEVMVKDQIKKLEEPAIKKLKEISDFIKKSFIELAQSSFVGFPNLIRIAKSMIESIKQEKEAEAELMLRTQFKMELIVYTQDSIYSHSLSDLKQETQKKEDEKRNKSLNLYPLTFCYLPDNRATLRELMSHIKSYYKIASKRLADQVPLVIRYLLLQELAVQLQREMHKMPNDTKTTEQLLQEEHDIGNKRANLLSRKKRLTQARDQLAAF